MCQSGIFIDILSELIVSVAEDRCFNSSCKYKLWQKLGLSPQYALEHCYSQDPKVMGRRICNRPPSFVIGMSD